MSTTSVVTATRAYDHVYGERRAAAGGCGCAPLRYAPPAPPPHASPRLPPPPRHPPLPTPRADPVATLGAREFDRATAGARASNVERVPVDANMFSELPGRYPPTAARPARGGAGALSLPTDAAEHDRLVAEAAGAAGARGVPSDTLVTGPHRHKYFRRPHSAVLEVKAAAVAAVAAAGGG
jgi:hypothetical protein